MIRRKSFAFFLLFLFTLGGVAALHADPPRLPPGPPPACPLVCLQLTDFEQVGTSDTWRFEFESLNWTAFNNPRSSSAGAPAEGLVFVRNAALSTVNFRVVPVDPNGAPLGVTPVSESATVSILPSGDLGIVLSRGFVAEVDRIFDPSTLDVVPSACYELSDSSAGVIVLATDPLCAPFTQALTGVTVDFTAHEGDMTPPNTWISSLCTPDQIIWARDPAVNPPLTVPPELSNRRPCPATCADKDSFGNVLDGFVVEVDDFQPGDQLVFNWYLLGSSGPIALGSPPTPSDPGNLQPSPTNDPVGFSFGSYQIDRIAVGESCPSGDCDTVLVTTPPVTDPSVNCLVDESLNRDDLPFDIFASLNSVGSSRDCQIEPVVTRDAKGIERLMVRVTSGPNTDEVDITFTNLDSQLVETQMVPLQNASTELGTETLVGRYRVAGFCRNTATGQRFDLNAFTMAVPRRGDLAQDVAVTQAFALDATRDSFALTATVPGGVDLSNVVEACHFVQLRDSAGNVRIVGTSGPPDILSSRNGLLVRDTVAPTVSCAPAIAAGTDADGGADCSVEVRATAIAADAAGGFVLTNSLDPAAATRSFGAAVGGQEVAVQTASASFAPGSHSVTFTVTDDAGATASCATPIAVADDTAPLVDCALLPDNPPPGNGNGGGNGNGNGNGGNPPGQAGTGQFFFVDFSASDNCDPAVDVRLVAEIDGVPVQDGDAVQIVLSNGGTVDTSVRPDGRLRIQTPLGGVLTVTGTDLSVNQSVCQTTTLRP